MLDFTLDDQPGQFDLFGPGPPPPPVAFVPDLLPGGADETSGYNLFLAIFPQDDVAHRVGQFAVQLRQQHGLHGQPLLDQRLHITLHVVAKYGQHIPLQEIEAAKAAASSIRCRPFPITLDRARSFEAHGKSTNPFVLRSNADSDKSVARLRQQLAVALRRSGLRPTATTTPHMTLLYDRQLISDHPIEPMQWMATRFALILSHVGRTHHQWLGQWQLG